MGRRREGNTGVVDVVMATSVAAAVKLRHYTLVAGQRSL